MKKLFTMIVLAMVLVGLAFSAEAGVKKIRPDQLKIHDSRYDFIQEVLYLSAAVNSVSWTAVVRLPVGKRITKLKYYHRGTMVGAQTEVDLYRVKMGESSQLITFAISNELTTGNIISVENTSAISHPNIKDGYTYYVRVQSNNIGARIHGIKIFYQD